MIWIILIGVALLLVGPLRTRAIAAWRILVPVVVGGIVGGVLATMFVKCGAPAWMMIAGPVIAALMIGSAGRKWLDDNMGPKGG